MTMHETKSGGPFANISHSNVRGVFYYRLNFWVDGVRYRPVFKKLTDAILARDKFIAEKKLKPPIDRPEIIKLKNLDPEIWTVKD
jgi:hypothetical protein